MAQTSENQKFLRFLKQFTSLMLIYANDSSELEVAPKRVLDQDEDGVLWFAMRAGSPEAIFIQEFGEIQLAGQSGDTRFVSVRGPALIETSHTIKATKWSDELLRQFPRGPADPLFALVKVIPHEGEFWDHAAPANLLYLADALGAYILHRQPQSHDRRHGRVNF